MTTNLNERNSLSAKGLLSIVRESFKKVHEPIKGNQGPSLEINITDCLLSALAIFKLKFPSLLQFENQKVHEPLKSNLKNLFGVQSTPCDTYLRERLDQIDPEDVRPAFKKVFSALQRGKVLERFQFLDGKYLLLSDGTGFFSSDRVHCEKCCEKHHRDGSVTYYHQMLAAVIAHPDCREVIPICPEPIMNRDGMTKNDCERNASERLLRDFRREHPHLKVILVEDALSANGPHLKLLKELKINFITVVKCDGNKSLFEWIDSYNWEDKNGPQAEYTFVDANEILHQFRFVNHIPFNDTHSDLKVNFLEYSSFDKERKRIYKNTWITDTYLKEENVYQIARGGRTRWHIENETFNTLKNQGYNFEHNYGHGYKNLSTVFARLMILAFLIDQSEQLSCSLFQGSLNHLNNKKSCLWETIRNYFNLYIIPSWEDLYKAIIMGDERKVPVLDTS